MGRPYRPIFSLEAFSHIYQIQGTQEKKKAPDPQWNKGF